MSYAGFRSVILLVLLVGSVLLLACGLSLYSVSPDQRETLVSAGKGSDHDRDVD